MTTMHDDDDNEYDDLLSILLARTCQSVVVDQFRQFNDSRGSLGTIHVPASYSVAQASSSSAALPFFSRWLLVELVELMPGREFVVGIHELRDQIALVVAWVVSCDDPFEPFSSDVDLFEGLPDDFDAAILRVKLDRSRDVVVGNHEVRDQIVRVKVYEPSCD